MTAGLWGLLAAAAFGSADFCGRLSGRALGPRLALFGVMAVGAVALSVAMGSGSAFPTPSARQMAWVGAAGIAATLAPLALYKGMTFGPMSLVGPICGAYPALIIPVDIFLGARPSLAEWAAMAATMAGVLVVARTASDDPDTTIAAGLGNRRRAIGLAAASAVLFAAALLLGRQSVAEVGATASLWIGRWVGIGLLLALILAAGQRPVIPRRWWALVAVQGLLDAGGVFAFYLGSQGTDAPAAAVASSGFMVVAVLLGRIVLKERVSPTCWLGIWLVCAGVAVLASAQH